MSGRDIAKMRDEQDKYMPDVVYVQSLNRTSDGAGGWTTSWQTVAVTKGRIAPVTGDEAIVGGKVQKKQVYMITVPANVEITEGYRLQIGGIQYEILSILNSSQKTATRLKCTEV